MKKSRIVKYAAAYVLALAVFTGYVLMDTFIITKVYGEAEAVSGEISQTESSEQRSVLADESKQTDDNSYNDGSISVQLNEYRENNTSVYVADVKLESSSYLKTAFAYGLYGRNIRESTSDIAAENGAVIAINGDYYGAREAGYVIRNGVLYRSESAGREDLVVYRDGSFGIVNEDEITAEELIQSGAVQTLSFGPSLVTEGEISVGANAEVGQSMASNPRTAIGIIDENHYVMVVSDGRTEDSAGLSLYELAEFMKSLGCTTAYNLDGGGSSTMYFNGEVVNNPTGGRAGFRSGSERAVSDIIYVGYDSV